MYGRKKKWGNQSGERFESKHKGSKANVWKNNSLWEEVFIIFLIFEGQFSKFTFGVS